MNDQTAQTDLSLCWVHMSEGTLRHVVVKHVLFIHC